MIWWIVIFAALALFNAIDIGYQMHANNGYKTLGSFLDCLAFIAMAFGKYYWSKG